METVHGSDTVEYRIAGNTKQKGWLFILPTGADPIKLSFPGFETVTDIFYDVEFLDMEVIFGERE